MSWALRIKEEGIFCTIYFVWRLLSKICVSQCIVYWIDFQNIHTFTYQKTLLYTLLLLVSEIAKSLQCILKGALLCLTQFLAIEISLNMIKNSFYFTSKALFVLKIFKSLS